MYHNHIFTKLTEKTLTVYWSCTIKVLLQTVIFYLLLNNSYLLNL